jgi:hypothetical protein
LNSKCNHRVTEFSKTFPVFYKWPDLTDVQGIVTSTVGTPTKFSTTRVA